MSEARKFLTAKRYFKPNLKNNVQPRPLPPPKPPVKRPLPSESSKNLAGNRMKRLRTSLNEDVKRQTAPRATQKRPTAVPPPVSPGKKSRQVEDKTKGYVFNSPMRVIEKVNVSESCSKDDVEDMEWTPSAGDNFSQSTTSSLHIVVDTNIFLSHLSLIKKIVGAAQDKEKSVIYVPWIVIEELDFIKDDHNKTNIQRKAQEAITYLYSHLKSGKIKGQSLEEVNRQKEAGKNPDDKIIACCLQVLEQKQMTLLTSDVNLKNKALLNHIPVCGHNEVLAKLSTCNKTKVEQLMDKMSRLCNKVIQECAKKAYGDAYMRMPICQTGRSLSGCIDAFQKYWFPVFQETLLKQFRKSIEDLGKFLSSNQRGANQVNELVRLCVRVCIFLKDVEGCRQTIEDTIRDLNDIKDS